VSSEPVVLVTCEYPPDVGGVAGYAEQVARGIAAAGARVSVLAPGDPRESSQDGSIHVSRDLGALWPSDLRRADAVLDRTRPNRLIVQWVPHGYGWRSMNVPFARWINRRAGRGDVIDVMVHEPRLRCHPRLGLYNVAVPVHWSMLRSVLAPARRVWMSTEGWLPYVARHLRTGVRAVALPVPCAFEPYQPAPDEIMCTHRRLAPSGGPLIGHFSAFAPAAAAAVLALIPKLASANPDASFALIGGGSERCRDALVSAHRNLAHRVHATGALVDRDLSVSLTACDVMIQPYDDGATTRRSSLIASLAHGVPAVASMGTLTESIWEASRAVVLVRNGPGAFAEAVHGLLADSSRRAALRCAALDLYDRHFHVRHTVAAMLSAS
jgi:glycosyltransferase involved in cell wall biosynthesis